MLEVAIKLRPFIHSLIFLMKKMVIINLTVKSTRWLVGWLSKCDCKVLLFLIFLKLSLSSTIFMTFIIFFRRENNNRGVKSWMHYIFLLLLLFFTSTKFFRGRNLTVLFISIVLCHWFWSWSSCQPLMFYHSPSSLKPRSHG